VAWPEPAWKPIQVRAMTRQRIRARNSPRRGESVTDRRIRFPGTSWQEIEALPQPLRWAVQRTIFHLLDEPVPTLAGPFPGDDPLPGSYEQNRAGDGNRTRMTSLEGWGSTIELRPQQSPRPEPRTKRLSRVAYRLPPASGS
jgi:hypothetical protein